jgi:hypothetical protein
MKKRMKKRQKKGDRDKGKEKRINVGRNENNVPLRVITIR